MIAIAAIAAAATSGVATAGDLDPPDAPAPTMKTLDQVYDRADRPPSWSRSLSSTDGLTTPPQNAGCNSSRFECLWPDGDGTYRAVLDRETGLVWERTVDANASDWPTARYECARATTAGRLGWRLPSTAELGSLVNLSVPPIGIGLPPDSPFLGLESGTAIYANTWFVADNGRVVSNAASGISVMRLTFTGATTTFTSVVPSGSLRRWCVRGPNSGGL